MSGTITSGDAARALSSKGLTWVNPLYVDDWDRLLGGRDDATLFYTSHWAKVLYQSYRFEPSYLARIGSDSIQTLFPVVQVRSWITGTRGVCLPFTDECRPLCIDFDSLLEAYTEVRDRGARQKWRYLEIRGGMELPGNPNPSVQFYRHVLDLRHPLSALWENTDSSMRRATRKARQCGVRVEITSDPAAMDRFYSLNVVTRKKHGLPPQPKHFFSAIQREVLDRGFGWIAEAKCKGEAIASAVFFTFGKHAIYKYGASNAAGQEARANNLLMWEAIEHLHAEGCGELHFGRSSRDNVGLRRYKRQFGAVETLLNYYKYDYRKNDFVIDIDRAFGWHNRVFSRMPPALSRLIGRLAYRHTA